MQDDLKQREDVAHGHDLELFDIATPQKVASGPPGGSEAGHRVLRDAARHDEEDAGSSTARALTSTMASGGVSLSPPVQRVPSRPDWAALASEDDEEPGADSTPTTAADEDVGGGSASPSASPPSSLSPGGQQHEDVAHSNDLEFLAADEDAGEGPAMPSAAPPTSLSPSSQGGTPDGLRMRDAGGPQTAVGELPVPSAAARVDVTELVESVAAQLVYTGLTIEEARALVSSGDEAKIKAQIYKLLPDGECGRVRSDEDRASKHDDEGQTPNKLLESKIYGSGVHELGEIPDERKRGRYGFCDEHRRKRQWNDLQAVVAGPDSGECRCRAGAVCGRPDVYDKNKRAQQSLLPYRSRRS